MIGIKIRIYPFFFEYNFFTYTKKVKRKKLKKEIELKNQLNLTLPYGTWANPGAKIRDIITGFKNQINKWFDVTIEKKRCMSTY